MAQAQMANMYGLGAVSDPMFGLYFTPAQYNALALARNAAGVPMTSPDVAQATILSTGVLLVAGGVLGALAGHFTRNKKRNRVTFAALGVGAAATYASFQMLSNIDTSQGDAAAIAARLGGWGVAAAGLGYGGWRAYKGR